MAIVELPENVAVTKLDELVNHIGKDAAKPQAATVDGEPPTPRF